MWVHVVGIARGWREKVDEVGSKSSPRTWPIALLVQMLGQTEAPLSVLHLEADYILAQNILRHSRESSLLREKRRVNGVGSQSMMESDSIATAESMYNSLRGM
jgi:hypothetical protein